MDPDTLLLLTLPQANQLTMDVRAQYIAMVTPEVGTQLGANTNLGIAYLAANAIVIADILEGVKPFPLAAEKEGQLAHNYSTAALNQAGDYYAQSKWGMLYYGLRRKSVVTFGTYRGFIPSPGR